MNFVNTIALYIFTYNTRLDVGNNDFIEVILYIIPALCVTKINYIMYKFKIRTQPALQQHCSLCYMCI